MPEPPAADPDAFVLRTTRLSHPPAVPEVLLHLADEISPLWAMTQAELDDAGAPPPYWAFAWAGGQALARTLLDRPELVAGRPVLDLASGSGICALAARLAGAGDATANDVDPFAGAAIRRNAAANGLEVQVRLADLLGVPPESLGVGRDSVVLAGDVCYEEPMAGSLLAFLRRCAALGASVLLGDPGRSYLPRTGLERVDSHLIATTGDLEGRPVVPTGVYRLSA